MHRPRKRKADFDDDVVPTDDGTDVLLSSNRRSYFNYMVIMFLMLVSMNDMYFPAGNKSFEVPRERIDFEQRVVGQLTPLEFKRAYRMDLRAFYKLHALLLPHLNAKFYPGGGGTRDPIQDPYIIDTKVRLSIALRYFAGGSVHDLKVIHGVSAKSSYHSIWGVVDTVNSVSSLAFHFPTHAEQRRIAAGFRCLSGAKFNKVVGAIDGLLIWMRKPNKAFCREQNVGEANWRCHRKDKFGFNFQAICDHNLKFVWTDMQWPGATSDYMAWVTSGLRKSLEDNDITKLLLPGYTLIGDNAYIKKKYMAVPFKGHQVGYKDAYNFYHSQLRINIERAFGAYVHRWAILRAPLVVPTEKVASLVLCLCRLHNYCIDEKQNSIEEIEDSNAINLQRKVIFSNFMNESTGSVVGFDRIGRPHDLLDLGHHFQDVEGNRYRYADDDCPQDEMLRSVRDQNLQRIT